LFLFWRQLIRVVTSWHSQSHKIRFEI
jgi:hypothetical protein